MLTKEERAAIAERANRAKYSMDSIFEILHGYSSPEYMSLKDDFIAMVTRVLDLCDTSNMVELPLDKDGQVIHIGDTVFDDCGSEWVVSDISFKSNGVIIDTFLDGEYGRFLPSGLTHKQPATIESLAEHVRDVLENTDVVDALDDSRTGKFYDELLAICGELERLSDNDE